MRRIGKTSDWLARVMKSLVVAVVSLVLIFAPVTTSSALHGIHHDHAALSVTLHNKDTGHHEDDAETVKCCHAAAACASVTIPEPASLPELAEAASPHEVVLATAWTGRNLSPDLKPPID